MPAEKALHCPRCEGMLTKQKTGDGFVYACLSCGGQAMNFAVLEHARVTDEFLKEIWKTASRQDITRDRECPHCQRHMAKVELRLTGGPLNIDICTSCQVIWFDKNELGRLPRKPPPIPEKELSPRAKMALARAELDALKERHDMEHGPPDSNWKMLLAFFGFPIEENDEPAGKLPFVTWGLCLICIIIYLLTFRHLDSAIKAFSFIPAQWYRLGGLTIISSFFLHGGLLHLIFNMYFLLIFGDNTENRLGRLRLALLLLVSHFAGIFISWLLFPLDSTHIVGASAGIAGVLGYYTFIFRNARIAVLWGGLAWGIWWLRFPVYVFLLLFVMGQIAQAAYNLGPSHDTSSLAHLIGIGVGLLWAITTVKQKSPYKSFANKA